MAESLINIGIIAQQEEMVKADVDSGDYEDSSSGSDRSYEGDDFDNNSRGDSGSGGTHVSAHAIRPRRKRRHGSHGSRRHKGGSRHKHKSVQYKPYPPREEIKLKRKSQELQEKENAAAVVRRDGADQQYMTFPVAPFNSTQYLMDEHSVSSPAGLSKTPSSSRLNQLSPQSLTIHSVPSTPADGNHGCIHFTKKDKEFTDIYTTVHAESLQSLPKEELVKHYMSLEEKVAALQKKVAEAEQMKQDDDFGTKMYDGDKDCVCDSVCCSDTNSLSSSNEEYVDLNVVNSSLISVEAQVCPTSNNPELLCEAKASVVS
ncbi:protein HEXIM2-like [Physella acuta]|uniref:protein HEXIM2-like n=1 Tax=Physella acuta TaxID=109671 RepID=UPI0027DB73FA|nr:protein HEXIM2-like [Physella acuta]